MLLWWVNLIGGRVAGRDGASWRIATDLSQIPLAVTPGLNPVREGDAVTVAVRPERIALAPEGILVGPNAFPCEIVDVSFLGAATSYRVRHGSSAVFQVIASAAPDAALRRGDRVVASFAPDAAVVLAG